MEKFISHSGIVAPIDIPNVDTDAIIPKQFLKSIYRTGFGDYLFDEWRYLDQGQPGMDCKNRPLNEDFVLNQKRYKKSTILLTRENFGCGSSREHAPWALNQYGFRVLISSSFADIFYNNCFKNAMLPIVLKNKIIDNLFKLVSENQGFSLDVNLSDQIILLPNKKSIEFDIDASLKSNLLEGLDEIGTTLKIFDKIKTYEVNRMKNSPWLFNRPKLKK
ncbi:MAG: 3-isopropylmalate dehydratase small subunit [Candidatus Marinimicrobia bacterium]|nr:3-isopropylmalate dehydratase small subunit [Candidatus Neomarinimicrobiota bacterium]OUW50806.1 MAG: 3-isopropylmalate dehydratase small subunit [bacterium TMED190]|tara:strand:- start:14077 stop:14733 length:657 start_codon:yes stop_codon:yes gene_type:complete